MLQVQLAKLAGCHVIGTCSTDAKGEFLKVSLLMFLLGPLFSKVSVTRASRKAVRLSHFQIQAWCFKFYFTLLERFFHRTRCKYKATKHDPFGQSENECYKRIMNLSEFKYKCPSSVIGKAHQRTKRTNKLFLLKGVECLLDPGKCKLMKTNRNWLFYALWHWEEDREGWPIKEKTLILLVRY